MDNFFTSPSLGRELFETYATYSFGTMKSFRKMLPKDFMGEEIGVNFLNRIIRYYSELGDQNNRVWIQIFFYDMNYIGVIL